MPVIETERLTKSYGRARGIEDVTISVEAAEVFGFLGPNGAGKTTAIRTLLDLLHPSSGSARVFGLDSHRDSVAIRARLGNLPVTSATENRQRAARRFGSSPACGESRASAAPRLWLSAFAPTSIARSASSRAVTGRRSA